MGGQFHDILPGTATPKAFQFAWDDQVLAMNQFAGVLTSATEAVSSGLDTRGRGTPLIIYNPLNVQREDVVEAVVNFPNGVPQAVRVFAPDGREVPAQLSNGKVLRGTGSFSRLLCVRRCWRRNRIQRPVLWSQGHGVVAG